MGPDGIPIEALKALEMMVIDLVHHLIDRIYETGVVLDEMLKSVFVTLPKKPGATECENFQNNFCHEPCSKVNAENYGTKN